MTTTQKVIYVCRGCGTSEGLSQDSESEWDVEKQEWVHVDTREYLYCGHRLCGDEATDAEVNYPRNISFLWLAGVLDIPADKDLDYRGFAKHVIGSEWSEDLQALLDRQSRAQSKNSIIVSLDESGEPIEIVSKNEPPPLCTFSLGTDPHNRTLYKTEGEPEDARHCAQGCSNPFLPTLTFN